jgi:hypothetical protein
VNKKKSKNLILLMMKKKLILVIRKKMKYPKLINNKVLEEDQFLTKRDQNIVMYLKVIKTHLGT